MLLINGIFFCPPNQAFDSTCDSALCSVLVYIFYDSLGYCLLLDTPN